MNKQPIDIIQLDSSELLAHLGDEDWLIALLHDLPAFKVTVQWRAAFQQIVGKLYVRWVLKGIERTLSHDSDPPWDYSGSMRQSRGDSVLMRVRHQTLHDWAHAEYTGESRATYVSGYGLHWLTYADDAERLAYNQLYELLKLHCRHIFDFDDMTIESERTWDDQDIIVTVLASALCQDVLRMQTTDAWIQYEPLVQADLLEEQAKAQRCEEEAEIVREFWRTHFPDFLEARIEMPDFKGLRLGDRVAEVLADTDPEIVRMLTEFPIPGNYSNSVRTAIINIARRALV